MHQTNEGDSHGALDLVVARVKDVVRPHVDGQALQEQRALFNRQRRRRGGDEPQLLVAESELLRHDASGSHGRGK